MDYKTFIERVSAISDMERDEVEACIGALKTVFEEALVGGDSISIPSFGSFEPRKRNERIMSSPSDSSKRLLVPPKVVVNFKPSVIMKGKLNETSNNE